MANALYAHGREALLGDLDWGAATIKAALVEGGYTPDLAADQYYDDLGANVAATSTALTTKTLTSGVADADDVTFVAVAAGPACDFVVLYEDTGSGATSRLIALIDTGTGLPVTPNGGDVTVTWDSGVNKIFKL